MIDVEFAGLRRLCLLDDGDVRIIGERHELQAPPIAGRGDGGCAVVVGVFDRCPEGIETRPHGVVSQRRHDHRVAGLPEDLHGAADAVVDVGCGARGGKPGGRPLELHDEAGVGGREEADAGGGVEVVDQDLAHEDVDDVDVVPDTLHRDLLGADLHAADGTAGGPAGGGVDRVGKPVAADERADVVVILLKTGQSSGAPPWVGRLHIREGIGVDAHQRPEVVAEVVPHDHRLRTASKDRGRSVSAPGVAIVG